MRVGSLFSGIGGLDLGLERAGMEVIWQVEQDPFCNKVLERHWPEVKRYGDIKEVDWSGVEKPDLICGGFPCQPFSQAARGRNPQKSLWGEFARALAYLQPSYAIVENVPAILRWERGIREVLGDLASMGYVSEWATLPAAAFGAPHKRARLWLVAYPYGDSEPDSPFYAEAPELPQSDFYKWLWSDPSLIVRMDDGIPSRVDRLRALGNAVVPQCAEWIGRRILEL